MKTIEEIEKLKKDWQRDPCWDIEMTEGFEEYRNILFDFRIECEHRWKEKEELRLYEYAVKIGIPGNIKLAEYLQTLEYRIATLENA